MAKLGIEIITHPNGEYRAIATEYEVAYWNTGDKGVSLTEALATEHDVHEQFAELEAAISNAKARALKIVLASGTATAERSSLLENRSAGAALTPVDLELARPV